MGDERRRFTRVPFRVKTQLEIAGQYHTVARTYNLSIGGCLLTVDVEADIDMPCCVKFLLSETDDSVNIQVDGKVIRNDDGMIAVKFIQIDLESLFHLRNIIRYNALDSVEAEIEKHPGLV